MRNGLGRLGVSMLTATLAAGFGSSARADSNSWYQVRPQLELGFLSVLSHRVQFGDEGTDFDYVESGGQDNLFFVSRFSVDLAIVQRHTVVLLYQPLDLRTAAQVTEDLVVDDTVFERGTGVAFTYGFPFYRVSYLYDLFSDENRELAFGASVQLRNATIEFASTDGEQFKSYRGVGVVPLLKARGSYTWDSGVFFGFEIDGIYAPIRGANASDNDVKGALLDASLRAGLEWFEPSRLFFNLRYIGGGASGQSDPEPFSDGRTENWLHLLTVSLGADVTGP
jgi:hypothetical protein